MNESYGMSSRAFRIGKVLSFGSPFRTQLIWLSMSSLLLVAWGVVNGYLNAMVLHRKQVSLASKNEVTSIREWVNAEDLRNSWAQARTVVMLFWLVLIVVLTYSVVKATEKFSVNARKWNGKWAIGGWFIPVANFFIPFQVLRESERVINNSFQESKIQDLELSEHLDKSRFWFFGNIVVLLLFGVSDELTTFDDNWEYDQDTFGIWSGILGSALLVAVVVFAFVYFLRQNLFVNQAKLLSQSVLEGNNTRQKRAFEPPPSFVTTTQDAGNISEQIRHLGKLRDDGLITSVEFEQKKSQLLDRI